MSEYLYRAVDKNGNIIENVVEVQSKSELIKSLAGEGLFVTFIKRRNEYKYLSWFLSIFKRTKREDIAIFTTQLWAMLSSGLPLSESLKDLAYQTENVDLKVIINGLHSDVSRGEDLSFALSKRKNVFPEMYVNMIKAAEQSGSLDIILRRLSDFYTQEISLIQKAKTAMTYPVVLVIAAVAVITFILINFIPKFISIFERMAVPLPLPTYLLYRGSIFLQNFGLLLLLVISIFIYLVGKYIKTSGGKRYFDKIKLQIPIFGQLFLKMSVSRCLRTLGTLYASGVPILKAVDISARTMDNTVLSERVLRIIPRMSEGENLADLLREVEFFSPMVIRMVATGEKSGTLDIMLERASNFYDNEIENTIERLSTLLEPGILIIMGTLIAFIMASTLLPMFQMVKMLRP